MQKSLTFKRKQRRKIDGEKFLMDFLHLGTIRRGVRVVIFAMLLPILSASQVLLGPVRGGEGPSISLLGGVSFPTGPADFSDNWKTGYNLHAEFEYPWDSSPENGLVLLATFQRASYPFDAAHFRDFYPSLGKPPQTVTSVSGPSASIWGLTGGSKIYTGGRRLYARIDLGYFNFQRGDVTVSGPDGTSIVNFASKDGFLVNLGAGGYITTSRTFDLVLEADYSIASSSSDEPSGYLTSYGASAFSTQRKSTSAINLKSGMRIKF